MEFSGMEFSGMRLYGMEWNGMRYDALCRAVPLAETLGVANGGSGVGNESIAPA